MLAITLTRLQPYPNQNVLQVPTNRQLAKQVAWMLMLAITLTLWHLYPKLNVLQELTNRQQVRHPV